MWNLRSRPVTDAKLRYCYFVPECATLVTACSALAFTSVVLADVCQTNVPVSNPDSIYAVHGNGTVTDTRTGLMWKVCSEGQTWEAGACAGTATYKTWANALSEADTHVFAGQSDWRLPNIRELSSLLEQCAWNPPINQTVFPSTAPATVWSGSPYVGQSDRAWYVSFFYGGSVGYFGRASALAPVRLVRGGQSFSLPSTVSNFTPTGSRLDVPQTHTITGTNFVSGSTTVSIDDCPLVASTQAAPNPVITPTQITVTCKPSLPGLKRLLLNGQAIANRTVFVDHPTRMGNPAARGIPAISGVSLFNGNYFHEVTDMSVPGKGMPFTLRRSYNSYYWREEAKRGTVDNYRPWRFNWELQLGYVDGTNSKQLYVEQADGAGRSFFQDTDNQWYPVDQGSFDQVKFDDPSVGFVTFYERKGVKNIFEAPTATVPGRLKLVRDHAGNTLTVAHDPTTRRITSVTDTVGRVFDFTYYPTGDAAGRDGLLRRVNYAAATALYPAGWYVQYDWIADNPPENPSASPRLRARLASVRDVRGQLATYSYVSKAAQPAQALSSRVFLASHTDTRGNRAIGLTYSIDVFGNWGVDRVENAASNYWNFQYCAKQADNTCGGVTTAVSFENRALPPAASGLGNRTARFDVAGRPTGYVDGRGNVTTITPQPTAALTAPKQYNLAGLTTAQQTQLGNATGYAYTPDNAGNLAARTDALGKTWIATYAAANAAQLTAKNLHLPSSTASPLGLTRGLEFHSTSGVLTKRVDTGGAATSFVPNAAGQIITMVDPRFNPTDYEYVGGADNLGGAQVTRIWYPDDVAGALPIEDFKYDLLGRVRWFKDKLGAITETEYDEGGLVTATKRRRTTSGTLERTVLQGYDAAGNLAWRVDARGQRTEFAYDTANRQTTSTVKANATLGISADIVTTNIYDSAGRLWKTTNPNAHTFTTVVDNAGNTTSRSNHLNDTTTYAYDADNRLSSVTDPEGRITKYEYDAVGRVRFTETNAGATIMRTERRYDADGRLTHQIEARAISGRKNETQYTYHDATSPCAVCKGRLWKVFDASQTGLASPQPSSVTLYDAAGNVTSITDPRGNTTTITYDNLNREILRTYPGTTNTTGTEYNLAGQVTRTLANGVEKIKNTYDEFGQLTRTDFAGGFASYTYDANGNRTTMTDHVGTTNYAYDGLNRLIKITDVWGKVLEFAYDGAGNRTGIKYPNGQWVYYDYDAAERMITVRPWWATSAAQHTKYTLDRSGRVTNAAFGNGTSTVTQYDSAGRMILLENKSPNVPGGFISRHALTLDDNGNWASADQILPLEYQPTATNSATFTHDASNRIASATINGTGQTITYDTAGRMTRYGGTVFNQAFDGRDLLLTTEGVYGSLYNGDGHRVARANGSALITNIDRKYLIDQNPTAPTLWNIMTEADKYGQDMMHFVYGYGLLAQVNTIGQVEHYHFDPTGNSLALSNSKGEVSAAFAYSPYGESQVRATTQPLFLYSGKHGVLTDSRNGVVHMRARAYRPAIGRFLSLDAVNGDAMSPQTVNRYAYGLGDPIGKADPRGLWGENLATDQVNDTTSVLNDWDKYDQQIKNTYDGSGGWSSWKVWRLPAYVGNGFYRAFDLGSDTVENIVLNTSGTVVAWATPGTREETYKMQKCAGLFLDFIKIYQSVGDLSTISGKLGDGAKILRSGTYGSVKVGAVTYVFKGPKAALGARGQQIVQQLGALGGISKDIATSLWEVFADSETGKSCIYVFGG